MSQPPPPKHPKPNDDGNILGSDRGGDTTEGGDKKAIPSQPIDSIADGERVGIFAEGGDKGSDKNIGILTPETAKLKAIQSMGGDGSDNNAPSSNLEFSVSDLDSIPEVSEDDF